MAVQGRCIGHLIDLWLADPYFQRPPPRWYPLGVRPDAELHKTVQMAVEEGWTVRDLLCTATHFIAESIARAVRAHLPAAPPLGEILLSGGGARNGFLLAEIARRLPGIPQRSAIDETAGGNILEAAAAAVLGLMHIDQMPSNPGLVTGARSPRVLGRLTPGSSRRWERLLQMLARIPAEVPKMRQAI
jgi:anhydro-N-acetylmuramic acid kinase